MAERKRLFQKNSYDKGDTPIRILDGFIFVSLLLIVLMVVSFAVTGGYQVSFDTDGGTSVSSQKLRHGELVSEPEAPEKPGYAFKGWAAYREDGEIEAWDFSSSVIEGDKVLHAVWENAVLTVKVDLNGGSIPGAEDGWTKQVTYGEPYGELPEPVKEGQEFAYWFYSGEIITPETIVKMPGEHVLTAVWEERGS